jgi:hypothetical protein
VLTNRKGGMFRTFALIGLRCVDSRTAGNHVGELEKRRGPEDTEQNKQTKIPLW